MFRIESGIRQVLKKGYVNAKWFPLIKQALSPPALVLKLKKTNQVLEFLAYALFVCF